MVGHQLQRQGAALAIQRRYRGKVARSRAYTLQQRKNEALRRQRHKASVKIQAIHRESAPRTERPSCTFPPWLITNPILHDQGGNATRAAVREPLKAERQRRQELQKGAVVIQSRFRGKRARKRAAKKRKLKKAQERAREAEELRKRRIRAEIIKRKKEMEEQMRLARESAAIHIQAVQRGNKARRRAHARRLKREAEEIAARIALENQRRRRQQERRRREEAASSIQKLVRGRKGRLWAQSLREEKAAVSIQVAARGRMA